MKKENNTIIDFKGKLIEEYDVCEYIGNFAEDGKGAQIILLNLSKKDISVSTMKGFEPGLYFASYIDYKRMETKEEFLRRFLRPGILLDNIITKVDFYKPEDLKLHKKNKFEKKNEK